MGVSVVVCDVSTTCNGCVGANVCVTGEWVCPLHLVGVSAAAVVWLSAVLKFPAVVPTLAAASSDFLLSLLYRAAGSWS